MTVSTAEMINKGVWRDVFDLYAEGLNRLVDADFWGKFFWPRADALSAKYKQNTFCIDMLIAIHSELERAQQQAKCGG